MKTVTCNKCGWVHFQVSRNHAEAEYKRFNEYYDALSKQEQEDYYGGHGSSIKNYEHCHGICGGSYKNFRDSKEGDCPNGVTMNPIIDRDE